MKIAKKNLKSTNADIKQEAIEAINEAKKDDKEVDTEENLDKKLSESRIQVDNLDGNYSIIALDNNLKVKGRVISDKNVVEVGATIVTVDKETQNDAENLQLNNKEFTFDLSNLKPGSNKVNIYAYLSDGTLVEKVIFIETLTKELTIERPSIIIEDNDNKNEETLDDIVVFNSKTDPDVKYIGVINGSKTSESIGKVNLNDKPVLFIRVGTYVARQLDSIVTENEVKNDAEKFSDDEFLPNTTYYKTTSVEVEDLFKEDEINLFFAGFDTSQEPEMIFNEDIGESFEQFLKDNNLDTSNNFDFPHNEDIFNSEADFDIDDDSDMEDGLNNEDISYEDNILFNSESDNINATPMLMNYSFKPVALASSPSKVKYSDRIKIMGKPSGNEINITSLKGENITAKGRVENINKYAWMSLHGGYLTSENISDLSKGEAEKFAKSMINDLWNMLFEDEVISKTAKLQGVVRASIGAEGKIPLSDKKNKNVESNIEFKAIYNNLLQNYLRMNMQYSKKGLELFDIRSNFKASNQSGIKVTLDSKANFSAILKEIITDKEGAKKKNKKVNNKYRLLNNENNDKDKFYFASVVIPPMSVNPAKVKFSDGRQAKISELLALTFDMYFTSEGKIQIVLTDKRQSTSSMNGRVALYNDKLENETVKALKSKARLNKDIKIINTNRSNYKLFYIFNDFSDYKNYTSLKGTLNLNNTIGLDVSPRIVGERFLYLNTGLIDEFMASAQAKFYTESQNKKKTLEKFKLTGKFDNTIKYFLNINLENFKIKDKDSFAIINPKIIHKISKEKTKEREFEFDKKTQTITKYNKTSKNKNFIVIPSKIEGVTVKNIGHKVFQHIKIKNIKIPEGMEIVESYAFAYNKLEELKLPNSIKTIDSMAFMNNNLKKIVIPDSIKTIGPSSFANNQLEQVKLPSSVTYIDGGSFKNNLLTSIKIPNTVEAIYDSAFANNKLINVNIPNSVNIIGENAFYNNAVTNLTLPKNKISFGKGAFKKNKLNKVKVFQFKQKANEIFDDNVKIIGL